MPTFASVRFVRYRKVGFSLIELALVLAVTALIVGGVMLMFETASMNQKSADIIEEINLTMQVAHDLTKGAPSYKGLNSSLIAQSGLFPDKWVGSDKASLVNPFGGAITANSAANAGSPGRVINLWVYALPRRACEDLLTKDFGDTVIDRNVNGRADYGTRTTPPGEAAYYCQQGSNNFIGFNFL